MPLAAHATQDAALVHIPQESPSSHDPVAPEGQGSIAYDWARGGKGAADQRFVETPMVPLPVPQLPQMAKYDALGVDFLHGPRRIDPASGEEQP